MKPTPQSVAEEVKAAEQRIRPHIRETFLEFSPHYSRISGARVYFKLENLQYTGSFKARGAMNKVMSLADDELSRGVVTASTGNHGAAVAFALQRTGTRGVVFVPSNASREKLDIIEQYGVEVRYHGDDCAESEAHARRFAAERGSAYISPYNDPRIVGGQGTIAVELERQVDRIDAAFVALGGGGLISGVAGYLKHVDPNVRVVGCSPENSQVMIQSVRAGKILDLPSLPTLSEGTAGGVEPGAITFDLCRALVDDYTTVTEAEIASSLRGFLRAHHSMIEGAAAVAIAAFEKERERYEGQNVVIILCGANISTATLKEIL